MKLIIQIYLSSRLMCGAISPRRICLRVVHRVTLKLLPQAVGCELYVAFRDDVHCAILLRYVLTVFQTHLFGACRTVIPFPGRKPINKTKFLFGKTEEPHHKFNLHNQILIHQNTYTSDVSKSSTCFDKS